MKPRLLANTDVARLTNKVHVSRNWASLANRSPKKIGKQLYTLRGVESKSDWNWLASTTLLGKSRQDFIIINYEVNFDIDMVFFH